MNSQEKLHTCHCRVASKALWIAVSGIQSCGVETQREIINSAQWSKKKKTIVLSNVTRMQTSKQNDGYVCKTSFLQRKNSFQVFRCGNQVFSEHGSGRLDYWTAALLHSVRATRVAVFAHKILTRKPNEAACSQYEYMYVTQTIWTNAFGVYSGNIASTSTDFRVVCLCTCGREHCTCCQYLNECTRTVDPMIS